MKITFVCLGNICRSPLAEAIAKEKVRNKNLDISIDSHGTSSWHIGEPPCLNSQEIARAYNLDISHYKGSQINKKNIFDYDLVVGADSSVVSDLKKLRNDKNILLLGDFGYDGADVPDPYYYNSIDGFDEIYNMLDICIENILNSKYVING
jgi:protein-tyrosine phosphatase